MPLDIEKCKECYYADEDGVCNKCCVDNAAFEPKRPNERICEWISVKDRLPNVDKTKGEHEEVMVLATNGKVTRAMYYERAVRYGKTVYRWKWCWDTIYDYDDITHWMPLPEPPKGE